MGYFDSIKPTPQPGSPILVPKSNVVQLRDDVHPYAQAIRAAWLTRLDNLQRPWVKGSAWDTNCFVTARKLIELSNSPWSGYDPTDARADYFEHAPHDIVWDKREKCWDQAMHRSGGSALTEPEPGTPIPDVTTLDEEADALVGPPVNDRLDWQELFSTDAEDEEWIIEPILPARRMVALYSAPKAGKSLLMLEIAVAIARGTKVIGTMPDRPRRVLYVDFENDPRGDIRARLEAMELGPGHLDDLVYLSFPSLAKFDTAAGAVDLMRHVEHYECEVVVIDTVSRAVQGEENENDTWLAFYRHTGLALKRAGVACIRLDHSGKDREKGMRGGSAKSGDVDAVWRLTAVSDETVTLECTDHRMPVPTKFLTLARETWPLVHRLTNDPIQAVTDARVRVVDERLDALGVPSSASYRDAGKALRDAGEKVNDRAVKEAVKLRKLRLDMPSESEAASLAPHSASRARSEAASPPPLGGERLTGPAAAASASPHAPEDPGTLVSCKGCFRPTTAAVAGANGGLCAGCFRDTGQVTS
jgi:hypothetical protein